jgi:NADPH:quinone reductase-like Zn-dependent oxidoreductase
MEVLLDQAVLDEAQKYVYDQLRSGKLRPKVAKIFPFDQIVEAHRYLESNEQIGKIVVTI